ncbi:MAG TPA: peptidase C39 family protein [Nocardioides sp.]
MATSLVPGSDVSIRTRLSRGLAAGCALAVGLVVLAPTTPASAASAKPQITHLTSAADFNAGTKQGVSVGSDGSIRIASTPRGTTSYRDPYGNGTSKRFDYGRWISPWVSTGMDAKNMILSWNAKTSGSTLLRFHVRTKSGWRASSWDEIAAWGASTASTHRHSGSAQSDDLNTLLTDTLTANDGHAINRWQVQVTLYRAVGTSVTPTVTALSGVASPYAKRYPTSASRTTMTETVELKVPRYSQMTHTGHEPQWGGGGEAWCSPTSTSMVLRYWKAGPTSGAYAWSGETDGHVDHAARYTYDHAYRGNGNWPFNTAYAAHYNVPGFVTRLWSLTDVEKFIKAGIPVIVSVAFKKGQLTGAPISSTNGHLMVITGISAGGRVIANDPAAPSNWSVRRVYDRRQFEKVWLNGSGGIAYVIAPEAKALPASTGRW